MRLTLEEFQEIAEEAYERIPESFRERFQNLVILVDREPSAEQLRRAGVPHGGTLLGLYHGVPLSRRGFGYSFALPDQITLFQGPIERSAGPSADIAEAVYRTLWHELAHHLGMNEQEVRSAEKRRHT